jgi:WD40 repeat protein
MNSDDTDVKVWNSETGKNIANLKGHSGSIYSIKMTSDGSFAMSVGTDKYIRIWDVRAKAQVCSIDGTAYGDMNEIVFTNSPPADAQHTMQSQLAGLACVGHTDGSLTFWDVNMRKCLAQYCAHQQEARGVSFNVDGKYLASAGFDGQIVVTDTSDLDNLTTVKTLQHEDKVVSVKWHPHLPLLLSTSADKTARVWYPQA